MRKLVLFLLTSIASFSSLAEQCSLSREQVNGESKFCFYACLRGERVLTIGSLQRCPLLSEFNSPSVFNSDLAAAPSSALMRLATPHSYESSIDSITRASASALKTSKDE